MRKGFALLLGLLCLTGLAACGGGPAPYETSAVQAMADAGAFSEELEEVDPDTAFLLYKLADHGLERADLTGCAVLRSAGATCEEGAVLILSGEEQAEKAAEAVAAYVADQIEANAAYRPKEIPKLEDALVDRRGNTLLLAVAGDMDKARQAVGLE